MTISRRARPRPIVRFLAAVGAVLIAVAALAVPAAAATPTTTSGIDVRLPLGHRISGHVTDPGGQPVAGAGVSIDTGEISIAATTDPTGDYVLHAVPDGTYRVHVDAPNPNPGLLTSKWYGVPISVDDPSSAADVVVAGGDDDGIDVELGVLPDVGIAGTVRDPDGGPVAGVTVNAFGDGGSGEGVSGSDGAYRVTGLPPGSYTLFIQPPTGSDFYGGYLVEGTIGSQESDPTTVDVADADVTGVDVRLIRGVTISGHVTSARAVPIEVDAIGDSFGRVSVDASGDYHIPGLMPGTYTLIYRERLLGPETTESGFFPFGAYGEGGSLVAQDAAFPIDASAGDVTVDPVALPRGTDIVGTVTDGHAGLAGAYLFVCDVNGALGCSSGTGAADGSFRIRHVPTGSFSIFVSVPGRPIGYYRRDGFTIDMEAATPVKVVSPGPDTKGVTIVVPPGGSVAGRITGAGGTALAGAHVIVLPFGIPPNFQGFASGSDGRYRITGVWTGDYRISIQAPAGSDYRSGYYLAGAPGGFTADESTATEVRIVEANDRTAPYITVRDPASGAVDIAPDTTVSIRFSEPVTGVDAKSVQLRDPRGKVVPAVVSFDVGSRTASLAPNAPLLPGTRFRVVIGSGLRDWSGNAFGGASWSFDTAP